MDGPEVGLLVPPKAEEPEQGWSVVLSLDHARRGLGTASCVPDTHPRHRLVAPGYRFACVLRVLP